MTSAKAIGLITVSLAGFAALGACANSGPRTPDEFNVVRKAPLTVPPEYNLRPPTPGESRPQDLEPEQQARVAIFGQDFGREASEGEKLLVRAAGGDAVARSVRSSIDFESAQIVRKSRSLTDSILSFGRSTPSEPVVDAEAEAERLRAEQESVAEVTGGGQVIIKRRRSGKLPGL